MMLMYILWQILCFFGMVIFYILIINVFDYIMQLSPVQSVPEIINLDDNTDKDVGIFVRGGLGIEFDRAFAAKRNLSTAFDECSSDEGTSSKISKLSPE
jgi:hypothetical protein